MLKKQPLFSLLAAAILASGSSVASDTASPKVTVSDWLAQSSASDWRELDADNTLYLQLPTGRVVIELAKDFAPMHISNIKALVREGFYQNIPIVRVQDN